MILLASIITLYLVFGLLFTVRMVIRIAWKVPLYLMFIVTVLWPYFMYQRIRGFVEGFIQALKDRNIID